ncbi:MAG: substrate-binding domain-containing protein [Pseudomonadota bacterium]|nr:substrate-binding domain-containing protein [Pseudomonadota bacterium]
MKRTLHVLCAGAVQGLVKAVQARFMAEHQAEIDGRFGAVGAMKEALMSGVPCDVLIVTETMLRALHGNGAIDTDASAAVGRVRTGVAVREGEPIPAVDSTEALKAAFVAAPAIYVPDTVKSTAGAHVAAVIERLGLRDTVTPKLAIFANGATAMTALANRGEPGALGCTQVTEIVYTPFLTLAGRLPDPFGLATTYSAGVSKTAGDFSLATNFIALLCGPETASLRRDGGFESIDP